MDYAYCGYSGLQLPRIALGLWHNFGDVDNFAVATDMVNCAFESGITHFDLANNYGPSPGSAELNFGRMLKDILDGHRDEIIISTKAGYKMWEGVYGDGGSRKYLIASLDQSLQRMGLDYVDIFYSHRYDANTPIEETARALSHVVRQGKALYVGISNYPTEVAERMYQLLASEGTPCLISQEKCSLLMRRAFDEGRVEVAKRYGVGTIAFSPLAQGLLTDRYIHGIPADSRAAKIHGYLQREEISPEMMSRIARLNEIAAQRGQTLAEMSLAWLLREGSDITSVIIGASSVAQLQRNLKSLDNLIFTEQELQTIIMAS
ncbi:glyceraldehyde 3-phosphate reductase [Bacteroidia bacterium]|nr:glyceraldehyde 3-phosphate reductase [Bacteroidia bacterium]